MNPFDVSEWNLQTTPERPQLVPDFYFENCFVVINRYLDHTYAF
jgi:hypothetical protein